MHPCVHIPVWQQLNGAGNARNRSSSPPQCQHGAAECRWVDGAVSCHPGLLCLPACFDWSWCISCIDCCCHCARCRLNRIINCAQKLHPSQRQWFPFVVCLQVSGVWWGGGGQGMPLRLQWQLPSPCALLGSDCMPTCWLFPCRHTPISFNAAPRARSGPTWRARSTAALVTLAWTQCSCTCAPQGRWARSWSGRRLPKLMRSGLRTRKWGGPTHGLSGSGLGCGWGSGGRDRVVCVHPTGDRGRSRRPSNGLTSAAMCRSRSDSCRCCT